MLQVLAVVIHYILVEEFRTSVLTPNAADIARTSCAVLMCPNPLVQSGDRRAVQPPTQSRDTQCSPQPKAQTHRCACFTRLCFLGGGKEHPVCQGAFLEVVVLQITQYR